MAKIEKKLDKLTRKYFQGVAETLKTNIVITVLMQHESGQVQTYTTCNREDYTEHLARAHKEKMESMYFERFGDTGPCTLN